MDPQSQAFVPNSTTATPASDNSAELARIQQIQAEHSERIARLERRQDDDARLKSVSGVWGGTSPFPSVLSGTPQQAPYRQHFDDDPDTMMSSLHLDAEDEPRRGLGAASRANSVRFDETANQNFSHSTRPSVEFMSRTPSGGLGGLQMNERSSSHKSEGRASSQHSVRSAASGRANSLNLDSAYGIGERLGLSENPGLAPGLLLLGTVPAIIRCWMNTNFKHDALLYAAVCTGSYRSFLDLRLIRKLGFEEDIRVNADGVKMVELPVYFPEAVPHPSSSRSSSPAPQLPNLTVDFQVVDRKSEENDKAIQIFLGSDVLREHSADILFSSNNMTLFDDERSKLSIPLVRPESEEAFKSLFITSSTVSITGPTGQETDDETKDEPYLNGLNQASSTASVISSATTSPPPTKYRPPGIVAAETSTPDSSTKPDPSEARPTSRQSNSSARPSLTLLNTRSELRDSLAQGEGGSQTAPPLRSGSSPAIWSNWRRDTGATTPAATTAAAVSGGGGSGSAMDWANASRNREASYQRKDTGIKVLKPKSVGRTVSSAVGVHASSGEGKSRFFDEGRRKSDGEDKTPGSEEGKVDGKTEGKADSVAGPPKTKANPIGGGSAFSWLGK